MKSWATTLIFLSLITILVKIILPKGEKSPLYAPFRFLASLLMIILVFSPLIRIFCGENNFDKDISEFFCEIETESTDVILLKKFASVMNDNTKKAFPKEDFSFEIHTDENKTPILIKVVTDNKTKGEEIAQWIKKNYNIETKVK